MSTARTSGVEKLTRPIKRQHWALFPFVAGVIIGLAISTVALIRVPYNESVTNVYVSLGEDKRMESLSDFQRLMDELHPAGSNGARAQRLSEEIAVKSTLFYGVVVKDSNQQPSEQLTLLKNTWTRDVPESDITFFVPSKMQGVTHKDKEASEDQGDEETKKNIVELGTAQPKELQALDYICRHKLNDSKWFFISYDDLYVKTHKLEAYLQQFETLQDQLGYLGRPTRKDRIGQVCLPGPGSILSFNTISVLCPLLASCMKPHAARTKTDFVLGECLHKVLPEVQCNKDGDIQQLFVKFDESKRGSIMDVKNRRLLERSLTLFPVTDPKVMYNVHQFVVAQRLNDSQHQLQELKLSLDLVQELLPQSDVNHHHHDRGNKAVTSQDDVIEWKLINHNLLMSDEEHNPALRLPSIWRNELNLLTQKTINHLNSREEGEYTFKRIMNAYYKVEPFVGVTYIIDFEAKVAGTEDDFNVPAKRFWVSISRPYNPPELNPVLPFASPRPRKVIVAVFMTEREGGQLQKFMEINEGVLAHEQGAMDLIVVVMKGERENQNVGGGDAIPMDPRTVLSSYEGKYPKVSFNVIESSHALSRDHGISLAIRDSRPNDILFIADLDLEFDIGFMERCRNFPLQGQQVYFPILFSKISPRILRTLNHTNVEGSISEHSGHWLHNSTSTACLYVADILAAIQQPEGKGIPNEVEMRSVSRSLIERGYEVVRSTDKGLWRRYAGGRECELDLYGERHEDCESSHVAYEQLYIKTQLSVLLFDHEGEHSENKF